MGPESWTEEMDKILEANLVESSKVDDVVQFFTFRHLPEGPRRDTSRLFAHLAYELLARLPRCPQRTHALNHILSAKDAAVRAALPAKVA